MHGGIVRFADRLVLSEIDLAIGPHERIAVIGDNGAGKSTLLGVIAGTVPLTNGKLTVNLPGGISLAEQSPNYPLKATVAEALDMLLADVRQLESEVTALSERLASTPEAEQEPVLDQLAAAIDQWEARDGYNLDQRLESALEKLGLGELQRDRLVDSLSGGERARLALAAALSSEAELLLLDEPTNDLDDAAILWLENRIAVHRGALVVVTHDRAFLDRVATDIVHLESGSLRRYGNGYSGFLKARETERQKLIATYAAWRQNLARQKQLVSSNSVRLDTIPQKMEKSGFGHGAFRARGRAHGAMSRIRMAKQQVSRLLDEPAKLPTDPLSFTPPFESIDDAADSSRLHVEPLLSARHLRLGEDCGGQPLSLDQLDIGAGARILVTGPNGAGKTTLLRVLACEITPEQGTVEHRTGLRIGWLRQDLDAYGRLTLQETFAAATHEYLDEAVEHLLSFGLFRPEDLDIQLGALSVGMRRRYELAVALAAPCDLLLLDEPTNHLAPELIEQLEDALDNYDGAVITVTHDRRWKQRALKNPQTMHLTVELDRVRTDVNAKE
ncbi:hypothetical protein ccrud_06350 [Corynebacterium crudilactis]|uniref:ABC transporter domain-containing protein n=1 Tax=Corynebacterium crudilactis TaxID=1652495 RepID=A0A172QX73_9CORY|nr:hypothetical protein ccrud_06350 [Corynebacterium crudilactis]